MVLFTVGVVFVHVDNSDTAIVCRQTAHRRRFCVRGDDIGGEEDDNKRNLWHNIVDNVDFVSTECASAALHA